MTKEDLSTEQRIQLGRNMMDMEKSIKSLQNLACLLSTELQTLEAPKDIIDAANQIYEQSSEELQLLKKIKEF